MFIFLAAFNFGVVGLSYVTIKRRISCSQLIYKNISRKTSQNSHENAWGYSVPCQKNRLQHRFISCQFYTIFQKNFWRTSFIYVLKKRCSKIVHQINRRAPMLNMISISIAFLHECCPLNLLHIFRAPIYKNTYGVLFLDCFFMLIELL